MFKASPVLPICIASGSELGIFVLSLCLWVEVFSWWGELSMHALIRRLQRPLTGQFNPDWTGSVRPINTKFVCITRMERHLYISLFPHMQPSTCLQQDPWITALSLSTTSSSADSIAEKIKIALKWFCFHCGSDALINVIWCFLSSVYRLAADERIGWGWHKRRRVNGRGCVGAPNYLAVRLSQPPCGVHKSTLWLERGGNEGPLWPHTFTDTQKRTHFSVNNTTADPTSGLVI